MRIIPLRKKAKRTKARRKVTVTLSGRKNGAAKRHRRRSVSSLKGTVVVRDVKTPPQNVFLLDNKTRPRKVRRKKTHFWKNYSIRPENGRGGRWTGKYTAKMSGRKRSTRRSGYLMGAGLNNQSIKNFLMPLGIGAAGAVAGNFGLDKLLSLDFANNTAFIADNKPEVKLALGIAVGFALPRVVKNNENVRFAGLGVALGAVAQYASAKISAVLEAKDSGTGSGDGTVAGLRRLRGRGRGMGGLQRLAGLQRLGAQPALGYRSVIGQNSKLNGKGGALTAAEMGY
jgi:hypothetical protein